MTPPLPLQSLAEILLGAAALALLARDLYRAWLDKERRPITLLVAGLAVVLLAGTFGGREHPHALWLLLPGAILAWEVARGWRRTPRCHRWEAGVAAFAVGLVLTAAGLAYARVFLIGAFAAGIAGFALFWLSKRREPRPWRAQDIAHYERRAAPRPPLH
jgi:hypothetical protein